MTKLYFHAALAEGPGIYPAATQSTVVSDKNAEAQTVNRSMNTSIGVAQTSIVLSSLANVASNDYYFTKFVSQPLSGITSITAQTWNYAFAAAENNLAANFPVSSTNLTNPITIYVWRPSTNSKVGNILDGYTGNGVSEPSAINTETSEFVTFTGSLVSNVQDGDVIVCEIWFRTTQGGSTARNDTFYFDGTVETNNTRTTVSDHASYVETPQSLTFQTLTAYPLYFHAVDNPIANLPTSEQSALTSAKDADAQTVNRLMDSDIGTSQTSITLSSINNTSANDYYFTKFVSWNLKSISAINAGTWRYAFAASESNASANFPVGAANSPVYLNVYVWRPSTQTEVGTIIDGNTFSQLAEPGAINSERSMYCLFQGAAVASVQDDDVIIAEIWFRVTQAAATAYTDRFYFDGATETNALNTVVADHASYIATWQSLTFAKKVIAALPTETAAISETSIARLSTKARGLATETVSKSETIDRLAAKWKRIVTIERWF